MEQANVKHAVYKYVYDNNIIYIGKADAGLEKRIRQHGKKGDNIPKEAWPEINKARIFYTVLSGSNMTDIVERELIRRYTPKYNVQFKSKEWDGLPIGEMEWHEYERYGKSHAKKNTHKRFEPFTSTNELHESDPIPKYLQLPCTAGKCTELKKRITSLITDFLILNIMCNRLQTGGSTVLDKSAMERFISPFSSISKFYWYKGKRYQMFCNPEKFVEPRKVYSCNLQKEIFEPGKYETDHSKLEMLDDSIFRDEYVLNDTIAYYLEKARAYVEFLKKNYPCDSYNYKIKGETIDNDSLISLLCKAI